MKKEWNERSKEEIRKIRKEAKQMKKEWNERREKKRKRNIFSNLQILS